jgi:hypothetical protein
MERGVLDDRDRVFVRAMVYSHENTKEGLEDLNRV